PPGITQVVLELHAERAVVPEPVDPAVDLRRLEDEAAPLAERHQALHQRGAGRGGHGKFIADATDACNSRPTERRAAGRDLSVASPRAVLAEPVEQAIPAVLGRPGPIARAIVREEAVRCVRVDDDLRWLPSALERAAHLLDRLGGDAGIG